MGKVVQKGIRFPQDVVDIIEKRAQKTLGIDFNEYVKLVIMSQALEMTMDRKHRLPEDDSWLTGEVEIATPELEKEIAESMADYKAGRYTTLNNTKEIKDYYNKLNKKILAKEQNKTN